MTDVHPPTPPPAPADPHDAARAQAARPASARPRGHRELPGDLSKAELVDRILRVDHAGEFGAQRIYDGQLAVLKPSPARTEIDHMARQERVHYEAFQRLMAERRARPTLLHPLWNAAGWLLGAGSALLGERAAMACTVAVEETIVEHYRRQCEALESYPEEAELSATLARFCDDEQEHHDIALAHDAERAPFFDVMRVVIRRGSLAAIWLSERL